MFVLSLATLAFAADPPAEPPTVSATPGRGFNIATVDGKFSMNIRGRIMLRETLTGAIPDDAGGIRMQVSSRESASSGSESFPISPARQQQATTCVR